ncbi:zinc-binding metallopeptidase family protein [Conexibacter woesei]|uniref:Peptidase M28 domain-containing protein n=1 Tax=Conexibacter woesei (strain DSM 14684 / CCUG 47730 / CIP 108061 / JCM 11494 / NBRC 100937 / ID131577) TaxID=469383 RepID=D3F3S9_CONWI|nr:hypothetical protein [Conexibacter woesei]ADB54304.1 hypothetical protein Cwoe_5904 [Conexibacter woesei DSM 14684]
MLDPRIYRAAFLPVLFALVLVGFSLRDQPRGVTTTLAPEAFDGDAAFRQLDRLATAAPQREPGSAGDEAVARTVEQGLRTSGFDVSVRRFDAQTSVGKRTVETVIGERTGFSSQRILVVAQRDAIGTGARAQLSGTAALLELARVLGSRTLNRTLVLASVSGGPAAAKELAEHAGGEVDAVIVLGDLAGTRTVRPVVVPWADGEAVAPLELRRTVETAVAAETGAGAGRTRPFHQFTRLAFPLTLGLQGPFNGAGLPAVLLSVGGERPPAADQPVSAERLTTFGRAALRSVSALDGARELPAPEAYITIERKLLPAGPIRLLAIALLLPVLLAAVDGFARVRRRHEPVGRWLRWVGVCALPFVLAVLLVRVMKLTGLLDAAPSVGGTAFAPDAIPRDGTALAALAAVFVLLVLGWFVLRPLVARLLGAVGDPASPGAAAAVLLVLCAVAIAVWIANPYAALVLIPALHLWLLAIAPEVRLHPLAALALFALGLVPPLLVAFAYARQFGLDPLELAWMGLLLVGGGSVGLVAALGWAIVLGCAGAVLAIIVRASGGGPAAEQHVTVRGPKTYAGPGSLGGTESALRR